MDNIAGTLMTYQQIRTSLIIVFLYTWTRFLCLIVRDYQEQSFIFFQTLFVSFALKELFYTKFLSLFMSSFFFISYKMCKGLNAVFAIVQAFKDEPNEFK
jgi:hypothetical protein